MIEIDGSHGSGGGAVLRVASALAAVTGKTLTVTNIRKGRPKPGLAAQHVEGLKAIASLCNGTLKGATLGSEQMTFTPGAISSSAVNVKVGTAGSLGLIFQTLKLPASRASKKVQVTLEGGATFGKWAPPLLASKNILLPTLENMGYKARIEIEKHGFYPAGGARTSFTIQPCKQLKPLHLVNLGKLTHVGGLSISSVHLEKARVAERQARAAERLLTSKGLEPLIKHMVVPADCPGSGIVLWATDGKTIVGSDAIGERWKKAVDVGRDAASSLLKTIESHSAVDTHVSDQLLVFMALARGHSKITTPHLTEHAQTNIWVIEQFLPVKFATKQTGGRVIIECSGS